MRDFLNWSCNEAGLELRFEGSGDQEIGVVSSVRGAATEYVNVGDTIVKVDPRYYRPAEVETLLGDPSKAREELQWIPEISVKDMCADMVQSDLKEALERRYVADRDN